MAAKEEGVFVTQKGNRRGGQAKDAVDADQLEEMVAGVAQTSQSTLLLKKKKEMREVYLERVQFCRTSASQHSSSTECLKKKVGGEQRKVIYVPVVTTCTECPSRYNSRLPRDQCEMPPASG